MKYLWGIVLCLALAIPAFSAETRVVSPPVVQTAETTGVVHGNVKSRIYHNASCRYFACKACTAVFASAAEARAHGYRACKICGG